MVASLGFLSIAIATDAGAEVQKPLAAIAIGGLMSSKLLTQLVLRKFYAGCGGRKTYAAQFHSPDQEAMT